MSRRLLAGWLAFALVLLAGLEIPLAISYAHNQRSDALSKLEHDAVAVGALAEDPLHGGGNLTAIARVIGRYGDETNGRIVIVDRRGRMLVGAAGASTAGVSHALNGHVWRSDRSGRLSVAVPVSSGGIVIGAVGITTPADEVDESIAGFRWTLAAVDAVALAVTIGAALLFSRWVTRPLRALEQTAARVGGGELDARARSDTGPPEVRSLARRFNETVTRLEALVRAQDTFVGDASHQLRTPLTALRLRLENGDVAGALGETERLSRIVDSLLALARAEDAQAERLQLAPAVAERLDAWGPVADERGVGLASDVAGAAVVGRDRFGQVLDNLLANALVAAPRGSLVIVHGDASALHIRDDGPGMSADDRARAFDRFWSRAGGSGLGLPIVKRLVEADGGSIELQPGNGGGLDVVLHLTRPTR